MPEKPKSTNADTHTRSPHRGFGRIVLGASQVLGVVLRFLWLYVKRIGGVLLALVVLFEQWGWEPLVAFLRRIGHLAPIAAFERFITRLPPYPSLLAFGLPSVLLLPLKLVALYLIAHGHAVTAAALFIGAKIVGTAVVARLYQLTAPKLMQIGWFRRGHDELAPRLHNLHEAIRHSWAWRYGRMLKTLIKHRTAPLLKAARAQLAVWVAALRR